MDTEKQLKRKKEQALVEALDRRHRLDLARPVELVEERGRRIVTIGGVLRFEVNFSRKEVKAFQLQWRPRPGEARSRPTWALTRPQELLVPLRNLPRRGETRFASEGWITGWCNARARVLWRHAAALMDLFAERDQLPSDGNPRTQLKRRMASALRGDGTVRNLHASLRQALGIDPRVIHLALRVRVPKEAYELSCEQLTLAWQHEAEFRKVERDNPRIGWLYALALSEEMALSGREPLQALKRALEDLGVGRRGWGLVVNHPRRAFDGLFIPGVRPLSALSLGLRMHEVLGARRPLPVLLQRQLLEAMRNRERDEFAYPRWREFLERLPAWRAFVAEATRLGGRLMRDFVRNEWRWFERWAFEGEAPEFQPTLVRQGWRGVAPYVYAHAEMVRARLRNLYGPWKPVLGEALIGPITAVEILDAGQLREEGDAMHHCAKAYIGECAANDMRFFSLRDTGSGRRVATASIRRADGAWELAQVAGFANAGVAPEIEQTAREIAALCAPLQDAA